MMDRPLGGTNVICQLNNGQPDRQWGNRTQKYWSGLLDEYMEDILFPPWLADIFLSSWVVWIVRIFSECHSSTAKVLSKAQNSHVRCSFFFSFASLQRWLPQCNKKSSSRENSMLIKVDHKAFLNARNMIFTLSHIPLWCKRVLS